MNAPSIKFSGSHFIDSKKLFGHVSIEFSAGKWTCLLGQSGVGKTTILRLILGLETGGAFEGEISASDDSDVSTRVSYMAQSDLLLPWLNVRDNIALGAKLRGEKTDQSRIENLIERVGLKEHQVKKPTALSGGMRQRAALARTLMENRPIVLLDEPFSALDAGTRAEMQELAYEMLAGKTIMLVTHDPAEASRMADQIIVLSANNAEIWPTPNTTAIRDINHPETLSCQSKLLTHLRGAQL